MAPSRNSLPLPARQPTRAPTAFGEPKPIRIPGPKPSVRNGTSPIPMVRRSPNTTRRLCSPNARYNKAANWNQLQSGSSTVHTIL